MNKRGLGIFGKQFLYTLLFLVIVLGIASVSFTGQFSAIFQAGQSQVRIENFNPLIRQLDGKDLAQIAEIAEAFHEQNTSFAFYIQTNNGEILYQTSTLESTPNDKTPLVQERLPAEGMQPVSFAAIPLTDDITLFVATTSSGNSVYMEFIRKAVIALGILIVTSIIGAVFFARSITNPIKKLAADTTKMANLEFVPVSRPRTDEIGKLSDDVRDMYERLKLTISELETEINHEKEMEENQRYFFSAASHELKTPIASTMILLQGMLDEIGEYADHPKYLRECIKIMQSQNKAVTEILEIVRLTDGKIQPKYETVEIRTIVQSILPSYQMLADAKEQIITVSIPDALTCRTDRSMISRALSNVIMNAVQNTPAQGKINIWSEEKADEIVRLCVLNTGTHIETDILPKVFEPFYREDKARSRSQGRSGLGLTIVRKTLDFIGILFSLENTSDGVLFWMDLPK